MNSKLQESMAAEAEIINSIRLVHGEAAADGIQIVAHQTRLIMSLLAAHMALIADDVPIDTRLQLQEVTRKSLADVLAGTTAVVVRDVEDPATRSALLEFTSRLIGRALDDVLLITSGDAS